MKKVISSLILAFTLFVSAQAFADPSSASMDAIRAKDWQRAESSLSQDLKTNRQDAKAWYFRAQVLNHLQRPEDAIKCLDNAVKLDPTKSFAASPSKVDELRSRLVSNSKVLNNSRATGKPVVTASSLEQQNSNVVKNTPVISTPTTISAPSNISKHSVPVATSNSDSGKGFLFVMFGFLAVIGLGWMTFSFVSKKNTEKAIQNFIRTTLAKLVDANASLVEKRDYLQISNNESTYLFKRIQSVLSDIDSHTRKLKEGVGNYDGYKIERTLEEVENINTRFSRKDYDAPVVPVAPVREARQEPAPRPVESTRQNTDYNQRNDNHSNRSNGGTTIINNGSNGDFLNTVATSILVNEVLNSGREREREVVREKPVYRDNDSSDDFGSIFGSSSNTYNDSSKNDDFSLGSDDFGSSSSDSSYQDSSDDDDFKL